MLAGTDTGFGGDFETFTYSAGPGTSVVIVDSDLPGEVGTFTVEVLSSASVELSELTAD